jgi:hypothetical protein
MVNNDVRPTLELAVVLPVPVWAHSVFACALVFDNSYLEIVFGIQSLDATPGLLVFVFVEFVDCCKQSLTRLSLPSIHPSSKVFSRDRFIYNIFFRRLKNGLGYSHYLKFQHLLS